MCDFQLHGDCTCSERNAPVAAVPVGYGGAPIMPQLMRVDERWELAGQPTEVWDALTSCVEKLFALAIKIKDRTAENVANSVTGEAVLEELAQSF